MQAVLVRDSATQLGADARGQVAVCGSHGGLYAAMLAAKAGVRAAVFNDAGMGRSAAGVGGIFWLGGLGIAACAVDCQSARIADGAEMPANGVLSTVNDAAAALGCRPVWALDSVSLVEPGDARTVVVTGSHGGLPGGKGDAVPGVDVFAALFNDAGGGKEGAGFARLPALDERGCAAATVWCGSARIGDGRSTYEDGVLSRVNEAGARRPPVSRPP